MGTMCSAVAEDMALGLFAFKKGILSCVPFLSHLIGYDRPVETVHRFDRKETNMDILRFIPSRDIREHLKTVGYHFSALEAAWLVFRCDSIPIEEKHAAWQEIIDTMPDCRIDCEDWVLQRESTHQFLREYMEYENEWIGPFIATFYDGKNAVYTYAVKGTAKDPCSEEKLYIDTTRLDIGKMFSSVDKCLNDERLKEVFACFEDVDVSITKHTLDSVETSKIRLNKDGKLVSLTGLTLHNDKEYGYFSAFHKLMFKFPVPFQKGDILWVPNTGIYPIVVDSTTPSAFDIEKWGQTRDLNEIILFGYSQHDNGTIERNICRDYLSWEYYPSEKLTDKHDILRALSDYLKGKIDTDMLMRTYGGILKLHFDAALELDLPF